ncbi:HAD-IIIC family phosphatase [Brevibacillus laterosporus]|uniref:HAD-IIIC family phosphatase n=1 Tax=Brevibacillus laterosporus TaxID=1465 RepID=UPI00215BD680|nr:HAD-IIIC family phosphatase [Brevibacillus laterosporus]MCR8935804.1 HAD-IIIC family phosphatase [Brevibacillus laterosporus]MCZ0838443.1 HAD-IIIC family phosphatase [Brevibacillus laterosporus]MCZ0844485.1 HAD-IIIC family phosphatase [Brevibacillus laterosporus]
MEKEIKCVIWDLDNTIWEGILLESPDVQLRPGIVEIIKELDSRGILHSIASKNHFELAYEKLREFGIAEYFLYPQINWNAKSANISSIQKDINIGMDTMLFIDDQPFERDEVSSVHPEVTCMSETEYTNLLDHPRLNPKFITEDSKRRRHMYLEDIKRNQEEQAFVGPQESFLASLEMKFIISEAQEEDLKRAEELTVRTNQLNSTGVTYDYDELNAFRTNDKYKLLVCELTDKYGSYGKIGLALVEITEEAWHVKLLLMSCRVMSRGVGTVLLSYIMQEAKEEGKFLLADFRKTDRNRMMYATYRFANFKEISSDDDGYVVFQNDLSMIQPFPPYIYVKVNHAIEKR